MGSMRIDGTWRSDAYIDDVWAVLVDLTNWPRWWPAIRAVELTAGNTAEPEAARITFDTPAPLRPLVLDMTVTDLAAPYHLAAASDRGSIGGSATFELEEDEVATAVRFDVSLEVRSTLLRPIELVLSRADSEAGRRRLAQAGDDLAELAGGQPLEHVL